MTQPLWTNRDVPDQVDLQAQAGQGGTVLQNRLPFAEVPLSPPRNSVALPFTNPRSSVDMALSVSVVIPTYNRAELLREAIASVLAQDYPVVDIIVVDDGSEEDIAAVVRTFPEKVRYLRQDHAGVSRARNTGWKASTADYIAFLDSDDLFLPGKLTAQVAYFARHPRAALVYSAYQLRDASGGGRVVSACRLSGQVADELLARCMQAPLTTPTVMVPRAALVQTGGFDESMHLAEDIDLWCRLAEVGDLGYVAEPLSCVRIHGQNLSAGRDVDECLQAWLRIVDKALARRATCSDATRRQLLSQVYWSGWRLSLGRGPVAWNLWRQAIRLWPWKGSRYPLTVARWLQSRLRHGWQQLRRARG